MLLCKTEYVITGEPENLKKLSEAIHEAEQSALSDNSPFFMKYVFMKAGKNDLNDVCSVITDFKYVQNEDGIGNKIRIYADEPNSPKYKAYQRLADLFDLKMYFQSLNKAGNLFMSNDRESKFFDPIYMRFYDIQNKIYKFDTFSDYAAIMYFLGRNGVRCSQNAVKAKESVMKAAADMQTENKGRLLLINEFQFV